MAIKEKVNVYLLAPSLVMPEGEIFRAAAAEGLSFGDYVKQEQGKLPLKLLYTDNNHHVLNPENFEVLFFRHENPYVAFKHGGKQFNDGYPETFIDVKRITGSKVLKPGEIIGVAPLSFFGPHIPGESLEHSPYDVHNIGKIVESDKIPIILTKGMVGIGDKVTVIGKEELSTIVERP